MKDIRSRAYLDLADGMPCIRCGNNDGTVVCAHYCGMYAHRLGRGAGRKAHDFCVAHLCAQCHRLFDGYEQGNDAERAAEFLALVLDTMARTHSLGAWDFINATPPYPKAA